jgi:hypothetical protein
MFTKFEANMRYNILFTLRINIMKEIHVQNHVIEQTKVSEWKAVVDEFLQLNQ